MLYVSIIDLNICVCLNRLLLIDVELFIYIFF